MHFFIANPESARVRMYIITMPVKYNIRVYAIPVLTYVSNCNGIFMHIIPSR